MPRSVRKRVALGVESGRRRRERFGVLIDADHEAVRPEPVEERRRVAAAAERAVDVDPRRVGHEPVDHLFI